MVFHFAARLCQFHGCPLDTGLEPGQHLAFGDQVAPFDFDCLDDAPDAAAHVDDLEGFDQAVEHNAVPAPTAVCMVIINKTNKMDSLFNSILPQYFFHKQHP